MTDWQPIATRPHEGRILIWCNLYPEPRWEAWVAHAYPDSLWVETDQEGCEPLAVTHWMPLPEQPK